MGTYKKFIGMMRKKEESLAIQVNLSYEKPIAIDQVRWKSDVGGGGGME